MIDDYDFDDFSKYAYQEWLGGILADTVCAFGCGDPATVTTSADDFVCEACKEVFEATLEGDSDE